MDERDRPVYLLQAADRYQLHRSFHRHVLSSANPAILWRRPGPAHRRRERAAYHGQRDRGTASAAPLAAARVLDDGPLAQRHQRLADPEPDASRRAAHRSATAE